MSYKPFKPFDIVFSRQYLAAQYPSILLKGISTLLIITNTGMQKIVQQYHDILSYLSESIFIIEIPKDSVKASSLEDISFEVETIQRESFIPRVL